MCGICGVWNYASGAPAEREVLRRMADAMAHRGPDDAGFYFDDTAGLGLGFRRLAIIDLSAAGHQPMANEDGSVWLVVNGEIYNFPVLRAALEARGHVFRSRSDSEVILHHYEEHGTAGVADLDGMFALAVWDSRERRLSLARDRVGKKPVYFYDDGQRLLFASELKALLVDPSLPRELDWHAFAEFLALGEVTGARAILKGISKLPAAHWLQHDGRRRVTERYWDWLPAFRASNGTRPETEWIADIRSALRQAVARRMISDVPLGAFLSGGVDSSAVVATMATLSSRPVKTFTIGFRDARFDDRGYARNVAQYFGTDHQEFIVEPETLRDLLPCLVRQYDEPFADPSALPTYYVAKLAREHVTVALSGDGGDEACAGYDRYAKALRETLVDRIPQGLRRALLSPFSLLPVGAPGRKSACRLMLNATDRYVSMMRLMPAEQAAALLTPNVRRLLDGDGAAAIAAALNCAADLDPLSRWQYADGRVYLPDDILVKVDRASMLNSLEVRCPLLDRGFLELMASVPPALRLSGGSGKWLFKRALHGVVPTPILERPKMGFGVPLEMWFRDDLAAFVREVLWDRRTIERGIFSPSALQRLIRAQTRRRQLTPHLWAALVFELWCRAYLDAH